MTSWIEHNWKAILFVMILVFGIRIRITWNTGEPTHD